MAIGRRLRAAARAHPRRATALLSLVGYALVAAAFAPGLPFPSIPDATVLLLGDAIAVVNTLALCAILSGVYFIRQDDVRRHRAAMLTAFALILVFLAMYLVKVGGGFEKSIQATGPVRTAYLLMLAVHILLSALAVPVVLHAVVLGLTHTPDELRDTVHPRVGRLAVAAWSLSLFLGIVTYLLLNHVYGWEPLHALLPVVAGGRLRLRESNGRDGRR
jgi:putative membrane protein